MSRPTRAKSAPANEQEAASADPLNRASVERGAALSSAHDEPGAGTDLSTERDQPVTPYPVPNFPDFAAVAPPRRRRGRPSNRERARRADELTRPVSHHRCNLRSKKNFRTENYSECRCRGCKDLYTIVTVYKCNENRKYAETMSGKRRPRGG